MLSWIFQRALWYYYLSTPETTNQKCYSTVSSHYYSLISTHWYFQLRRLSDMCHQRRGPRVLQYGVPISWKADNSVCNNLTSYRRKSSDCFRHEDRYHLLKGWNMKACELYHLLIFTPRAAFQENILMKNLNEWAKYLLPMGTITKWVSPYPVEKPSNISQFGY